MADRTSTNGLNRISARFTDGNLVAPVLGRLVSAAAAEANMPVDRIFDALAAVDALAGQCRHTEGGTNEFSFTVSTAPGNLVLELGELKPGEGDKLLDGTSLPTIGSVMERLANSVSVLDGTGEESVRLSFLF